MQINPIGHAMAHIVVPGCKKILLYGECSGAHTADARFLDAISSGGEWKLSIEKDGRKTIYYLTNQSDYTVSFERPVGKTDEFCRALANQIITLRRTL